MWGGQFPPSRPGPPGLTSQAPRAIPGPAGSVRPGLRLCWPGPSLTSVNLDVRLTVPGLGLAGGCDVMTCPVGRRRALSGGSAERHVQGGE